ncbi:asl0815 [Nostoc sp. PCC 7120 = FACHB-418]|nr:ORF2 [Nostoc sp. PCC 7120 = FACHB-418]BAB72772.1 asl0815 [Nostoc sp. PCC 7120 = FACHB-418]prf//2124368A ORF 2 [Anabaena sp.]
MGTGDWEELGIGAKGKSSSKFSLLLPVTLLSAPGFLHFSHPKFRLLNILTEVKKIHESSTRR